MNQFEKDIDVFLQRYNLPNASKFKPITNEEMQLRINHLREELSELQLNTDNNNWHEILDALVDLTYIAIGTARMNGMDFETAWNRIHTVNMQKIRCEKQADSKRGTTFDVIKPKDWQPADLSDLVEVENA